MIRCTLHNLTAANPCLISAEIPFICQYFSCFPSVIRLILPAHQINLIYRCKSLFSVAFVYSSKFAVIIRYYLSVHNPFCNNIKIKFAFIILYRIKISIRRTQYAAMFWTAWEPSKVRPVWIRPIH